MKWHDHPLMFRGFKNLCEKDFKEYHKNTGKIPKSPQEIVNVIISNLRSRTKSRSNLNTCAQLQAEVDWLTDRRPYYNIWPSVIKPFTNVDLGKVKCTDIRLPLPSLVIRFPVGFELEGAKSIFATESVSHIGDRGLLIVINDGLMSPDNAMNLHTVNGIVLEENYTIADKLAIGKLKPYSEDNLNDDMIFACTKLVVAICLLADSPDLIEQVPLESDRIKWEATHDINLIKQAELRGKREWNVGSHIEVAPGYRNAHFAIRWMGKGREVEKKPVLRPIKSCLVKRRQIEEIPTGWLDDE